MNIGLAKLRCTMLALRAKEGKIEGYSEENLLELKKFIETQERDLTNTHETENALRITLKGQDELIAQLNEDSDAQDKLVDRYEKALEVIDNALEKAATDEDEGEDPAVSFGISADGGGCRCSICDRGRWAKR